MSENDGMASSIPYGVVIVTHARSDGMPAGHGEDGPMLSEPDAMEVS